jgi:hypothetical protein
LQPVVVRADWRREQAVAAGKRMHEGFEALRSSGRQRTGVKLEKLVMPQLWNHVLGLEGKTLKTITGQDFTIESVNRHRSVVNIRVQSSSALYGISRGYFDGPESEGLIGRPVSIRELKDKGLANGRRSYVAAIITYLAELGGALDVVPTKTEAPR